MVVTECFIEGVKIIKPKIFGDSRGYFLESYNERSFAQSTGLNTQFVQDNESFSRKGTLRGIHFQKPPYAQAKLVRAITGSILDIVVDLRVGSETFGKWHSEMLSSDNKHQLFVPKGFGHGFIVLSESALFSYKVDNYYNSESDSGIIWNDEDLGIKWQIDNDHIILSQKDNNQPSLQDYLKFPVFNL